MTAGVLGIALATFVTWVMVGHDPLGGEPMAVAKVNLGTAAGTVELRPSETEATPPEITGAITTVEEIAQLKAQERAKEKALDQAAASRGEQIVTIIDGRSGAPSGSEDPRTGGHHDLPGNRSALVEITRDGPIPTDRRQRNARGPGLCPAGRRQGRSRKWPSSSPVSASSNATTAEALTSCRPR